MSAPTEHRGTRVPTTTRGTPIAGVTTIAGVTMIAAAVVTVAAVVAAGVWWLSDGPTAADVAALDWILEHRSSAWTGAATAISDAFAYIGTAVISVVVAVVILADSRDVRRAVTVPLAWVVGVAVTALIKTGVGRARPPLADRLSVEQSFSYPSGHTAVTAVVLLTLATVVIASHRQRLGLWATALLVTAVVGATRIYLGVHWLTDVMAGMLLGAALSALVTVLVAAAAPRARGGRGAEAGCGSQQTDR